jgi:polyphosphate kinase 2 (PPK2 family)
MENTMNKITPEKTHTLLEKLAKYVMNEVPTKHEVQQVKTKVNSIMEGMDAQGKQLDIIRTEQAATSHAINRMDKRIANLEQNETGYRIRGKEE